MNINFHELLNVIFRAVISLITLFLVAKLIGKKQVSQLSLFDYVVGISIGNFAAEMTINLDSDEIYGVTAVLLFGGISFLVSIITMKSIVLRRFFMGTPTILIQHGKLIQKNFYKVRYDINDMLEQCRVAGYFDISEIDYAIVEVNGQLSILPKAEKQPIKIEDMGIKSEKKGLCSNVIIDGKIMHNNLSNINKKEEWLLQELKVKGKNIEDILLATVDVNDKVLFYERNFDQKIIDILE